MSTLKRTYGNGKAHAARFHAGARGNRGLPCPTCGHDSSAVIDARPAEGYFRRRRECFNCHFRYTTRETILPDYSIDYQI